MRKSKTLSALWILRTLSLLAMPLALYGCGSSESHELQKSDASFSGSYPIKIVCTTGMVADMVSAIGGDRVQADRLMGEGVDPHVYEATFSDNAKLERSDIVFYNGLHLEPNMQKVFVAISEKKPVYAVGDYLKDSASDKLIALEGRYFDPHIWFDPDLWGACVPGVVTSLSKFDPANAAEYKQRGDAYQEKIFELTAYGKAQIGSLPEPRFLVTAHDAFSYFGRAFNVEVEAIQGVSTEAEASVGRFSELVDMMVKNNVKAVFAESSINSKNVEALLEGCAAKGHAVKLGGELYSDALGPENSPAGHYLGMVRHNIDTIVKASK